MSYSLNKKVHRTPQAKCSMKWKLLEAITTLKVVWNSNAVRSNFKLRCKFSFTIINISIRVETWEIIK